jgi:hypothetical protein
MSKLLAKRVSPVWYIETLDWIKDFIDKLFWRMTIPKRMSLDTETVALIVLPNKNILRQYATHERGIMGFMPPTRAAVTAQGAEGV